MDDIRIEINYARGYLEASKEVPNDLKLLHIHQALLRTIDAIEILARKIDLNKKSIDKTDQGVL